MTKFPSTSDMRLSYQNKIQSLVDASSAHEVAMKAGVTEPTINNAIRYPGRVKLETLEAIIDSNS